MVQTAVQPVEDKINYVHGVVNDLRTAAADAFETLKNQISANVRTVEIKVNDAPAVAVDGPSHYLFPTVAKLIAGRKHTLLVGPAGSGKSTVCEQAARALDMDFYAQSVCAQTSKSELLGYMSATGDYVSTIFRAAYEQGGVFVLDEIDAGNPNVLAVLNSALANGYCSFADGMVKRNPNFVLVGCANTYGTGASPVFVGRNQLDAATLDRFTLLDFPYDEDLEMDLATDKAFCRAIQAVRRELTNERVVISPRASIEGSNLLALGFDAEFALQTRVIKGMDTALKVRVLSTFKANYK